MITFRACERGERGSSPIFFYSVMLAGHAYYAFTVHLLFSKWYYAQQRLDEGYDDV